MKKTQFSNPAVFWVVVLVIGCLLLWNLYATLIAGSLFGLLPITIQLILLWLLFTKHQYAKIAVKAWAMIFLVIASGLQFFGKFFIDLMDGFPDDNFGHYLSTGMTMIVGGLIVIFVDRTAEVVETE